MEIKIGIYKKKQYICPDRTKYQFIVNKSKYTTLSIEYLTLESQGRILSGSNPIKNTNVIIPRGQKVDEYDFSGKDFSQDWTVSEP